jgi:cysteine desulfurase
MKKLVYADNAATTKLDIDAFEAMKPFLLEEYGNPSQPYAFSRAPKKAIKESREIIAECIGASPEEIYFTSGGSESDNWAVKGMLPSTDKKEHIITSSIEHHAILHACEAMERMGYQVTYVAPESDGIVIPETLSSNITGQTKLVSIMFANNEIGAIQPIKELCEIAHSHGAIFHTDAVQAVGHVPIDVKKLGIDMLSASAHKFNGVRGVGFLYIKKGTQIIPYVDGGSQEGGFRAGTENTAGIVCMAKALQGNCKNIAENQAYVKSLEEGLLSRLREKNVDFVRNGGMDTLPGLISLSFTGKDGEAILHRLDLMGIAVSTGSACNSQDTEISHVLKAIKLNEIYAKGTIRISLGKYNTIEDIEIISDALKKIIE